MQLMEEFLSSVEELESPRSYFYWSLLTAISAVVGKRVWVDRGEVYNLYPNIYTFIISKRSGLRKGVPVNVAKKLVHEVGKVRVIDGQNSIQGVIKELSTVRTVGDGHIIRDAEGFLVTGEFASFMLQDAAGLALTVLTDLYDAQYHEYGFRKKLSTQDEIELKSPCLTGLFASNETHFFDAVPKNAITGGFLARTFCIYEEKRTVFNSLTKPIKKKINYERIIAYLHKLSLLEGPMLVSTEAIEVYDDWYYKFSKDLDEAEEDDETGTSDRLGDNIWKAAMLISLCDNPDMVITKTHMDEAIEKTLETLYNVRKLLFGGATDKTNIKNITMKKTLACILETDPEFEVSRRKVLRQGAGVFGVYDLDEVIEHLSQAGMIKIDKRGSEVYYKLSQMMIDRHRKLSEET